MQRWIRAVHDGWGQRAAASLNRLGDALAEAMRTGDFTGVGAQLASDGQSLSDVFAWFELLARFERGTTRRLLRQPSTTWQLAQGWAEGALSPSQAAVIAPFDVLRLRLRQHFQLCEQLGVSPNDHAALIVVTMAPTRRRADHELLVAEVRRAFHSGETVTTAPNGSVLVFTARGAAFADITRRVTAELRDHPVLGTMECRVWIESLAPSIDALDAHLAGLAA